MSANKFVLKHHHVEVDYTLGITPGLPALVYKDGSDVRTFKASEISTVETGLGSLVSVALTQTIDAGGERFGFFLPDLDVPTGQTEKFTTAGVYETFAGPDSFPHLPTSWRCGEFLGTARTVDVPLLQPAH